MLIKIDEKSLKLFSRLKKITGRVQKIIVPIKDEEIPNVVRRRLFVGTDEEILDKAEEEITNFIDYMLILERIFFLIFNFLNFLELKKEY